MGSLSLFDGVTDRQGQVSILLQPGGSVCMILQMSRERVTQREEQEV